MSTANALLDAAEVAFAEHGVDDVSLRSIMRSIGANAAAVHYHFGSREALAAAVLDRILEPLQARRIELLGELVERGIPRLNELIEALVRPDFEAVERLAARNPEAVRLIGTIYGRPSEFVRDHVEASFAPVAARFMPHLSQAIPGVEPEELAWRVRWFVFGPLGALLTDVSVREAASQIDPIVERLVRSMVGALHPQEEPA